MERHRVYLISPANAGGERAKLLLAPHANFDLATRLRNEGITLGEAYAFISGLYFRGKLAYATAFATPPPNSPGAFVITGQGLIPPETVVTLAQFMLIAAVPIDIANPHYRAAVERDCRSLHASTGENCDFVLLGSVASVKYIEPMSSVFGPRLLFPEEFVGRGDMSRGGLLLRCARAREGLHYVPVGDATRHGPRPPRLPKLGFSGA
jgi:hypothetical protein